MTYLLYDISLISPIFCSSPEYSHYTFTLTSTIYHFLYFFHISLTDILQYSSSNIYLIWHISYITYLIYLIWHLICLVLSPVVCSSPTNILSFLLTLTHIIIIPYLSYSSAAVFLKYILSNISHMTYLISYMTYLIYLISHISYISSLSSSLLVIISSHPSHILSSFPSSSLHISTLSPAVFLLFPHLLLSSYSPITYFP